MAWSGQPQYSRDEAIILEAKKRYRVCEDWESQARAWYELDIKFANGDSRNMYQWDEWVIGDRIDAGRPCLTINKTNQHNLLIINDAKQNKPGINIRPVGEDASFEAAQVFQQVVRHIEYISSAENVYDSATVTQVQGGMGYWRVCTDYISPKSRSQEIYIRRIKDPRCVYLDPDITEVDGSDARFGFIFEDLDKDLYEASYPKFKDVGGSPALWNNSSDGWATKNIVRIAEYFRKTQKEERAVSFTDPQTGKFIEEFYSLLDARQKQLYDGIREIEKDLDDKEKTAFERPSLSDEIEWYKIAGNVIIDRGKWLGKYIPIVRLVGTETVIDGVLDRKGHTRALLDAQRMYNINTSANVEFGALQTKVPWLAPMAAVEGLEEYWKTANNVNHAWLPWNHVDEDGNPIPAPIRPAPPQSSPGYVQQMQIAQNEMMMVSGQYQAQMGENENAKSGVAINARQRQGDRATYHFIDNLAIAVRFTGKILIDLIPKIYDTKRIVRIEATDGSVMNVTIDTEATMPFQKVDDPNAPQEMDKAQQMANVIFNPSVGIYDVQSDTGPSFATRRQEAFNALTQIAASNKEFMGIAGDLLWKVADFPEAQALAERYRKIIPPNITGNAPDPQTEQMMNAAADHIQKLQTELQTMVQKYQDRTREFDIKERDLDLRTTQTAVSEIRADFDAMSKRITALGNAGPMFSVEQIQPLLKQAILEAMQQGGPAPDASDAMPGVHEGGTSLASLEPQEGQETASEESAEPAPEEAEEVQPEMHPTVPGARKAPDGNFYTKGPNGKYLQVMENA